MLSEFRACVAFAAWWTVIESMMAFINSSFTSSEFMNCPCVGRGPIPHRARQRRRTIRAVKQSASVSITPDAPSPAGGNRISAAFPGRGLGDWPAWAAGVQQHRRQNDKPGGHTRAHG
jgi:hypothetical protein